MLKLQFRTVVISFADYNFKFSVGDNGYYPYIWKYLFYEQELYWLVFESMMDWTDVGEREQAIHWFCENIPPSGVDVLTGFQNVNWFKKLISIVLNGVKYWDIKQCDVLRVRTLEVIFNQFRISGLLLNLKDTGVAGFMVHLAHCVIEIDFKCKVMKERGELFELQLKNITAIIESDIGWTNIFMDLFSKIYFYGRQTATMEDILPEFRGLFDRQFMLDHFEGPATQSHDFVDLCLDVYARASLNGI